MSDGGTTGAEEAADSLGCQLLCTIKNKQSFNVPSDAGRIPVLEDNAIKEEFISMTKKLISGGAA